MKIVIFSTTTKNISRFLTSLTCNSNPTLPPVIRIFKIYAIRNIINSIHILHNSKIYPIFPVYTRSLIDELYRFLGLPLLAQITKLRKKEEKRERERKNYHKLFKNTVVLAFNNYILFH